jgi:hypothetical protein
MMNVLHGTIGMADYKQILIEINYRIRIITKTENKLVIQTPKVNHQITRKHVKQITYNPIART